MYKINVKKDVLLENIQRNLSTHRNTFLKAQEGYREVVIELLDKALAEARKGGNVKTYFKVEAPVDHTEDYERVIGFVQMSIDDTIELDEFDYARYILDQWEWKNSFLSNSRCYSSESAKTKTINKILDM